MKKRSVIPLLTTLLIASCQNPVDSSYSTYSPTSSSSLTLSDLTFLEDNETYTNYELCFVNSKNQSIYGEYYLPKNRTNEATVVISHGFGSSYRDTSKDALLFANNGIASYVFDFCGGSNHSKSDGEMTEMSVLTEVSDLECVLSSLQNCDFINPDYLYLMGESQGGVVSALTASKHTSLIKAMVLFYPAFVIIDDIKEKYPNYEDIEETSKMLGQTVGKIYYTDIYNMDFYEEIVAYEKAVLIVHGSNDSLVPISYSQRAVEVYKNASLVTIEGANHGYSTSQLNEAFESVIPFINNNL